jgi:hypothetical protein
MKMMDVCMYVVYGLLIASPVLYICMVGIFMRNIVWYVWMRDAWEFLAGGGKGGVGGGGGGGVYVV